MPTTRSMRASYAGWFVRQDASAGRRRRLSPQKGEPRPQSRPRASPGLEARALADPAAVDQVEGAENGRADDDEGDEDAECDERLERDPADQEGGNGDETRDAGEAEDEALLHTRESTPPSSRQPSCSASPMRMPSGPRM